MLDAGACLAPHLATGARQLVLARVHSAMVTLHGLLEGQPGKVHGLQLRLMAFADSSYAAAWVVACSTRRGTCTPLCKACAADCRVGDLIKFGQSTRLCLLGGPEELLPDEGLNREQRRQQAATKVQLVTTSSAGLLVFQGLIPIVQLPAIKVQSQKCNLPTSWHVSGIACKQQAAVKRMFMTKNGKWIARQHVLTQTASSKQQAAMHQVRVIRGAAAEPVLLHGVLQQKPACALAWGKLLSQWLMLPHT